MTAERPQPAVFELPRAPGTAQLLPLARKHFFHPGEDGTRIDDGKPVEGDRPDFGFAVGREPTIGGRGGHAAGGKPHKFPATSEHDDFPVCDAARGFALDAAYISVLVLRGVTSKRWVDMNYWLVKSEPSSWSWDQQVEKGAKGEAWTGVRNFTARQNLVKMKKGDRAFFYHSNEGKEIVGIAEIIKEAYPDPTDKTGKFVCVDIKADKPLKTPVTMATIKADKKLADMALVKYSRLSVQPVTAEEWKMVCKMGGV
jgi:predicted RNA-binding protein with PUA-like domain